MDSFVHPKERFYFVVLTAISISIYTSLVFSKVGIIYIAIVFLWYSIAHGIALGHTKGNGVKITQQQFPEIFSTIENFSNQLEIYPAPEAYIVQSGGMINAFTSRLSRKNIIIITSEILELAYENNTRALNFVIGHELGHIKRKHPTWMGFLFPAMLIPFLGHAYSRACEYTCDSIASDLAPEGAVAGLLILSAGKKLPQHMNVNEFMGQAQNNRSFWVSVAERLSTHPVLPKRIQAVLKSQPDTLSLQEPSVAKA